MAAIKISWDSVKVKWQDQEGEFKASMMLSRQFDKEFNILKTLNNLGTMDCGLYDMCDLLAWFLKKAKIKTSSEEIAASMFSGEDTTVIQQLTVLLVELISSLLPKGKKKQKSQKAKA